MRHRRLELRSALLAVLAAGLLPGLAARAALPHITLDQSTPADGSVVPSPASEVRLFFSGAPLLRGASVRVATSGRSLMKSSPPTADSADPRQVFVAIDPPLPAGPYVVQWRVIADDGHVMRGDFTFQVTGE